MADYNYGDNGRTAYGDRGDSASPFLSDAWSNSLQVSGEGGAGGGGESANPDPRERSFDTHKHTPVVTASDPWGAGGGAAGQKDSFQKSGGNGGGFMNFAQALYANPYGAGSGASTGTHGMQAFDAAINGAYGGASNAPKPPSTPRPGEIVDPNGLHGPGGGDGGFSGTLGKGY